MKKIAIIGANSFLAKNFYTFLVRSNLDRNIDIRLYDMQSSFFSQSDYKYKQLDFLSVSSIRKIDFNVDYIFFYTGKSGTFVDSTQYKEFIQINETVLLDILNAYHEAKSQAVFVYPSTRLVYASSNDPVSENSHKQMKSIYAISKFSAENYIQLYNRTYGIKYIIFRICVPWGSLLETHKSYGTFQIFSDQAKENGIISVYGDGTIVKTYSYIEDICNVFYKSMDVPGMINDIYNVGGHHYSLNQIVSIIGNKYCVPIQHTEWPKSYIAMDGGNVILNSSKLRQFIDIDYKEIREDLI